jgi:hypothetical protein
LTIYDNQYNTNNEPVQYIDVMRTDIRSDKNERQIIYQQKYWSVSPLWDYVDEYDNDDNDTISLVHESNSCDNSFQSIQNYNSTNDRSEPVLQLLNWDKNTESNNNNNNTNNSFVSQSNTSYAIVSGSYSFIYDANGAISFKNIVLYSNKVKVNVTSNKNGLQELSSVLDIILMFDDDDDNTDNLYSCIVGYGIILAL